MNQSPAPWAVAQRSVGKRQATVVLDADRNEVCEVYDSAALIAAAPELLAALQDLIGRYERLLMDTRSTKRAEKEMAELLPRYTEQARAAIAKAMA